MRKWRSHKVIEAEEIFRVEIDSSDRRSSVGRITVLGGEVIEVPRGFFARNKPTPGDFLVRYEDGYLSWSPRGVFLAGNSEIEPDAPHRATGVPPGYPGGGPAATGDAGNGGYETATGSRDTR